MTKKALLALVPGLGLVAALALSPAAAGRTQAGQEMPGPLSASHASKPGTDCSACHVAPAEVGPAKCLACHTEIASRIAVDAGFHRDKAQDCGTCHAEHQGREHNLLPLDPSDFDHSETGADLRGAHRKIEIKNNCDACHAQATSLPRHSGRSYLLKVPGCRGCHTPPHPGRQDDCLACHDQNSWSVGRPPVED